MPEHKYITVYTDGSCNPIHKMGGWAAIVLIDNQKIILKGKDVNTTHQRMELLAVLKALEYLQQNQLLAQQVNICADSQYVIEIRRRRRALEANDFLTKKGQPIRNDDLVRKLISYLDNATIEFTKVAAHQKITEIENLNREADKLARSIIREHIANS
jgi:ribonuclease HI